MNPLINRLTLTAILDLLEEMNGDLTATNSYGPDSIDVGCKYQESIIRLRRTLK